MTLPEKAYFAECWARDGLQSQSAYVPTRHKLAILNKVAELGFYRMEVTSFANPKYMPQFSDQMDMLRQVKRVDNVIYSGLVGNMKGMEKALAAKEQGFGPNEIYIGMSASDPHNQANMNKSVEEYRSQEIGPALNLARDAGFPINAWIGTSFGCPIAGPVPIEDVYRIAMWFVECGATKVGFGDTTGMANPRQVKEFYAFMMERLPKDITLIAHFHDTRGTGIANCIAALEMGVNHFDTSLGGIGGQPANDKPRYHYGYTGNTCTEDLVCVLEDMGVDTGIDILGLMELSALAEGLLGTELRANVTRCGPVSMPLK